MLVVFVFEEVRVELGVRLLGIGFLRCAKLL